MTVAEPLPALRPVSRKVPMIIGCALCMELIDSTVVMTALPQMASDFGAPSVRMNLVVSLYMLAAALCVPVSGWAADRFGPRRLFVVAIVLFIVSSLACAASTSLLQLCLARMLQGAAGAMMVPVGQVILLRWSPREDLLRNLSYLTIPALIGPMIGPPLGGLMVTFVSWHWIFLINVPIGLLGIVLVLRHVPQYPGVRGRRLDGRGLLLSAIALGALVFGFEALGHGLLPRPWVALMIVAGVLCGALYIRHARRCAEPLLDLSLLRIPSYGISFWGGNLLRLGTSSGPFLLVLLFQLCFGLSPLHAGLLTLKDPSNAQATPKDLATNPQQFSRALHEARRENRCVTVAYIDLDNFKLINDIVTAAPSTTPLVDQINNEILTGELYKALKAAKKLIQYEQELLSHAK